MVRHLLNGQLINEPRNWQDISLTMDFINGANEPSINISNLEFVNEAAKTLKQHIFSGLSGGVGIFEGVPYRIEVGEIGSPAFVFNGYLDLANGVQINECKDISASLKKRAGSDWLNEVADSFSFRLLHANQVIKNTDFVKVPYVINFIPDRMQLLTIAVSLAFIIKESAEITRTLSTLISEAINANTPVVGVAIGISPAVVTAWDIGDIISFSLKTAANLAYAIVMLITIKNLMQQILDQLYPPLRYHLGTRLITLFEKACFYLGLTLKSNLLQDYKNWVLIPPKDHKGGQKPEYAINWTESGVPTDVIDTFGDLIRVCKSMFNADFRIINNEFQFERIDNWNMVSSYKIPSVFSNQEDLVNSFSLNTEEVIANYIIKWDYDTQDQNTLENQQGRIFQATLEPRLIINKELVTLKNLVEIPIPISLGTRKNDFTEVEKILRIFAKFVDGLTGIFGGGTNYNSKVESRKGALLLSSDYITKPKMVVMAGDKLATEQRALLSAKNLWNKFHFIRSFVEVEGIHNQYYIYEDVKIPFCLHDYLSVMQSNICFTSSGETARIDKLEWNIWENSATISYRVNKKYTDNLKIKYIEI